MIRPWVIFRLGRQRYCTDASRIREIITYRPASPIPGAPEGVEGIIKVRRDKITLYSGYALVENHTDARPEGAQHQENAQQKGGHIILLESGDALFGVSVDGVDGIAEIDDEHIDPGSASRNAGVLGTIPYAQDKRQQVDSKRSELMAALDLALFCENAAATHDL